MTTTDRRLFIPRRLKPGIFLDRDGVIIKAVFRDDKPCSALTLQEVVLAPKSAEGIELFHRAGFPIFVITNQPDIARGHLSLSHARNINRHMISLLPEGRISHLYMCPHDNNHLCACRKPKPGMLLRASQDYGIELSRSYLVGDRSVDVAAAKAVKCKSVLIDAFYNKEVKADYRTTDLIKAAKWIINDYKA